MKPNLSNPESQNKKFIRCTLNVRDLPLERFRLPRDGQKWSQAARSRCALLSRLATYANSDGTFEREEKNFSPSAKRLLQHYRKNTFYRLSNDLRELGLLSWDREQKHYGRRIYRIHLQGEKQVPHSQKTGPTMEPDNRSYHGTCYQVLYSPQLTQSTALATPDGASLRLLEPLPSARTAAAANHHQPEDDDDHQNHRRLKATALRTFKNKHGDEIDLKVLEQWMNQIEERAGAAGTRVASAEYFVAALESEAANRKTRERVNGGRALSRDSANETFINPERGISFWADKLTRSGAVSAEHAHEKVLEFVNEKGMFDCMKKCLDFFAMIRTNVFVDTPEPRENGEKIYFPKTVRKMISLTVYPQRFNPNALNIILDSILNYLHRLGEFKSAERRRQWENLIASQHERKKTDDRRWRYRKKVNQRRRELRAKRKVAKRCE